jgi:hypothetical protein
MKTTEGYVKALKELGDANEALMNAEIALEEKKAAIIQTSKTYEACTNEKQRNACILDEAATEIKAMRKAELAKLRATKECNIAEIMWKSEKCDILATVKVIA